MENPLSQAELDAILTKGSSIRSYDFRRPNKFNKDLLRTLVMVHDNFARLLQNFFSAGLRTRVQVMVRNTTQYSYAEFTQLLPNPVLLANLRLNPLPGVSMLEMSQNVAYAIVDRVLGGAVSDYQPQRALTEIELGVIQRTISDMLMPLAEAWRNIAEIEPVLEGIETNPAFIQSEAPAEVVAAVTLGVQIGEHMGHVTLALPYSSVEPVLSKLSPHTWLEVERNLTGGEAERIRTSVENALLRLRACLGDGTRIRVGDFMALKVGDVIPLNATVNTDIPVYVGNRLTFYGRAGVVGNRLSIQIRRRAPEGILWPY